jgi:hypothetical protein
MILVGNPEGKETTRKTRHRWEDNIEVYLRKIGWGDMVSIYLAQDRDQCRSLVNTVMNL